MIATLTVGSTLLVVAAAIAALMVSTWAVSLPMRNASIVDIVWGLGFVVVGWTAWSVGRGGTVRPTLVVAMVSLWGLRLASYLWWRNHGKGEDFRYRAMRRNAGDRFAVISLFTVFGLQGVLMFVVSLPLSLGITTCPRPPDVGFVALGAGIALWLVGMCFETVGDAQLARFKARPDSAGKVMRTGLWRYTRHPNYFGDFCVWWGIWLVTVAGGGWPLVGVVGPILMSVLLMRVSGVTLLEKSLTKRREGYAEYVATTSAFFPRRPRPTPATDTGPDRPDPDPPTKMDT
jgi:steroid 5-alpha reductase family enzyme